MPISVNLFQVAALQFRLRETATLISGLQDQVIRDRHAHSH